MFYTILVIIIATLGIIVLIVRMSTRTLFLFVVVRLVKRSTNANGTKEKSDLRMNA